MDNILKEFNRLEKSASLASCEAQVNQLLNKLEETQRLVDQSPDKTDSIMNALQQDISASEHKLLESEKSVYSSISKFGKALERTFKSNGMDDQAPKEYPIKSGSDDLNRAILMHLARNGEFSVASSLMQETELSVPHHLLDDFSRMYEILQFIMSKNLAPAIDWASANRQKLISRGSNLEFSLHKLQFIRYLLDDRDIGMALEYGRNNLPRFGDRYLDEISKLMTAVLYVNRLSKSPYTELLSVPTFKQVGEMFASEFCSLLGIPPESPLYLAVSAGSIAMPVLSKMESVMKSRRAEWTTKEELPVDIELPERFCFHSIFVCPVSKEQTTGRNPPMMLPCGHILARDSLNSLSKNKPHYTFKCPYCPYDTTWAQAKRVYF